MTFLLPHQLNMKNTGLLTKEVQSSHRQYGNNTLTQKKRKTFLMQFLSAFNDPIIKILLIALFLNIIITFKNLNIYEPLGIALSLFLATFVQALSEYGSESAFLKMQEQGDDAKAVVIRDKKTITVDINDIAVGDLVILSVGQKVPADGVITEGSVRVDMSQLNGESAEKERKKCPPSDEWSLDNKGQLFRGFIITSGSCKMRVGRVGDATLYGGVAQEVQTKSDPSPLTKRLSHLATVIGRIGYVCAGLVFIADLFNSFVRGESSNVLSTVLHALTLAITVVVVAVPEGLPMMITVVLSSNMARLKRDSVLVKRLVGIETAGCINMLFCDKTGTLTEGKLSVEGIYSVDGRKIKAPFSQDIMRALSLNNDAVISGKKAVGGNATDRAVLEYLQKKCTEHIQNQIPFDSSKKYSAVKCEGLWYFKGAPELFLKEDSNAYNLWQTLARSGIRVIAAAMGNSISDAVPICIVAIRDKLRRDTKSAVSTLKGAGVRVCMVTGDNPLTANAIAKECGILCDGDIAIDSNRLCKMTDCEVCEILPRLKVVARALPSDKTRLTRLAKESSLVCAMTGDGINDAPALKNADVGFAMGSGTEVAKAAGDIVILNDRLSAITRSVLYGRTIFKSIRKFIVFQLTINLCAVGVSVIGPFINIDTPVTVMQMLWINMIMDTLAGLAFAGEAPFMRYMKAPPISKNAHILNGGMMGQILFLGGYSLTLCILFLSIPYFKNAYSDTLSFMTAFFALFVFLGIFAGVCARNGELVNTFYGIFKNPTFIAVFLLIFAVQIALIYFGGSIFRTTFISPVQLLKVIALAFTIIPADFIKKVIVRLT